MAYSQWPLPENTDGPSRHVHVPGDKEGGLRTVCLAVSSGSDAKTSTYNRYSFNVSGVLPANTTLDYPKFGIWPDGYYYTANIFDANSTVIGTSFCGFERAAMLQDAAARAQCVFIDGGLASYLPADLDGPNPPLGASPNFLLDVGHPDTVAAVVTSSASDDSR